jgi:hypothetical protein
MNLIRLVPLPMASNIDLVRDPLFLPHCLTDALPIQALIMRLDISHSLFWPKLILEPQYISWIADARLAWTLRSGGMAADARVQISARPVPQEPMVRSAVHSNLHAYLDFFRPSTSVPNHKPRHVGKLWRCRL